MLDPLKDLAAPITRPAAPPSAPTIRSRRPMERPRPGRSASPSKCAMGPRYQPAPRPVATRSPLELEQRRRCRRRVGAPDQSAVNGSDGALDDPVEDEVAVHGHTDALIEVEKRVIERALELKEGNVTHAAKYLQVPRHILAYRMVKYGIRRSTS